MKKIIVIGGGAAGAKAASKAKRLEPNNQVDLYTRGQNIAYSLCGLPYFIEGSVKNIEELIIRTPKDFEKNGINVFLNSELQQILSEKNCVIINNNHIFYDELILALGAHVNLLDVKNSNAQNIFTLRSLKSGVEIKNIMEKSKTVLIVGAGYIAIELTEAFLKNGLNVIIVEKNSSFANDFDDDFSHLIYDLITSKYSSFVKTYFNSSLESFLKDEEGQFSGAILSDGTKFEADFCVLATGASPNTEIAKNAGIKLGSTGAINVDKKMRTNISNIYACGDCAQKYSIITRQPIYLGLGTVANKEGRVAAINAVGGGNFENFDGVLNSVITRFFDYTISKTGLSYKKALCLSSKINIEPIFANVVKKDKAGYMPQARELTLKLVADKRSGEILGAQAIGFLGNVAQRINTVTSALKSRMTVEDLLHLDLPYSPPFSSSIDPLLTACYKLKELMD